MLSRTTLSLLLLGCGSEAAPTAQPSSTPAPILVTPSAVAELSAESEMSTKPVELLKFTFTSGVDEKNPTDSLTAGKPGTKVFAHLVVRNRTGRARKVNVAFELNGKPRSDVELTVEESWSWRTWAYNTVPKEAKGTLRVVVTDDEGHPLGDYSLPIGG